MSREATEDADEPRLPWRTRLYYRLFGRRTREKACLYAAIAMAGRQNDENPSPLAWSLCVFFELYMDGGAAATQVEFGPKEPIKLKPVDVK